ncbi:hypothetical protein IAU60_000386 [Kwoniella sp. DSM 27419]
MPSASAARESRDPRAEAAKAKKKEEEQARARQKEYMKKCDPSTVEELVGGDETRSKWFNEGRWGPKWAKVEFNDDACLTNVTKDKAEGFYVPAGSILPLGAQMPEMTVLQYGGYFPEGTSFPGGVSVPMHARMVNLLPEETKSKEHQLDESLCLVQ